MFAYMEQTKALVNSAVEQWVAQAFKPVPPPRFFLWWHPGEVKVLPEGQDDHVLMSDGWTLEMPSIPNTLTRTGADAYFRSIIGRLPIFTV